MAKFYAVASGRTTGIFTDWGECSKSVNGYKNNLYKSFDNIKDAEEFIEKYSKKSKVQSNIKTEVSNSKKTKKKKTTNTNKISKQERKELKELNWAKAVEQAEKELKNNRLHYKDKPVNGSPTNKQIDFLKSLCKRKNLEISIIGITKKEASELIDYLCGKSEKKPACYKKYIKE